MTINLNDIKLSPVLESVYRSKISDAEYFSSSYSNYISNSRLKYINPDQGGSPSLYNNGIENKSTNSLELGTAIHELFLLKGQSIETEDTSRSLFLTIVRIPFFLERSADFHLSLLAFGKRTQHRNL